MAGYFAFVLDTVRLPTGGQSRQDAGLSPIMTELLVLRISFCVVDNKALNPL